MVHILPFLQLHPQQVAHSSSNRQLQIPVTIIDTTYISMEYVQVTIPASATSIATSPAALIVSLESMEGANHHEPKNKSKGEQTVYQATSI